MAGKRCWVTRATVRMRSKLHRIGDWEALAAKCEYSTAALAQECNISGRQLERFFKKTYGKSPREWLEQLRMRQAPAVLKECSSVKEAAQTMGYRQTSHFSRTFKKHHGISPEQWQIPSAPESQLRPSSRPQ